MNLSGGCHLGYSVEGLAWYRRILPREERSQVLVGSYAGAMGGVEWQVIITPMGRWPFRWLRISGAGVADFRRECPEVFQPIASGSARTAGDLLALLQACGAADHTMRQQGRRYEVPASGWEPDGGGRWQPDREPTPDGAEWSPGSQLGA